MSQPKSTPKSRKGQPAGRPGGSKPGAAKPGAGKPVTGKPGAGKPGAGKPAVKEAAAQQVGARKNPTSTKRPSVKPGKGPVYKQRKNPPLPMAFKVALALGWLAVNALVWYLVSDGAFRVGIAIVTLFALPLIVVLAYNPSRRRRR